MNIEGEQSFTPQDVYSTIIQAHGGGGGVINSEPFTRESYERKFKQTFERTCERTCEHSY